MSHRSTAQHCHIDTPVCTIRKSHVTWNFAVPGPHSEEIQCCILLFLCTLGVMHPSAEFFEILSDLKKKKKKKRKKNQCRIFAWLPCIAALADCHDVMLIDCAMKNASVDARNTIGLHLKFSSWKACKVKNSHLCARFWEAWRVDRFYFPKQVLAFSCAVFFFRLTSESLMYRPWDWG